jgi:hypothetical protein
MTRRTSLGCLWALLMLAGCADPPTAPTAALAEEFTLGAGERATITGTPLSVQFSNVENDSRCPADAVCVLGGDALVRIVVSEGNSASGYTLHTGSLAPVQHGDYAIALVALTPFPFSSRPPIARHEYRATLRVTRPAALTAAAGGAARAPLRWPALRGAAPTSS